MTSKGIDYYIHYRVDLMIEIDIVFLRQYDFFRFLMKNESVRKFAHKYVAWTIVWFRIKFLRGYSWYSEIDHTVILGALPIPSNVPELKRANVKLIISLCEPFELDFIHSQQEFEKMGFINKRFVEYLYRTELESLDTVFRAPEQFNTEPI
eukprot:sb/3473453/